MLLALILLPQSLINTSIAFHPRYFFFSPPSLDAPLSLLYSLPVGTSVLPFSSVRFPCFLLDLDLLHRIPACTVLFSSFLFPVRFPRFCFFYCRSFFLFSSSSLHLFSDSLAWMEAWPRTRQSSAAHFRTICRSSYFSPACSTPISLEKPPSTCTPATPSDSLSMENAFLLDSILGFSIPRACLPNSLCSISPYLPFPTLWPTTVPVLQIRRI
ncbi:hypothetical protein BJX63DRAFT_344060 [Aspergillus granulosus]|uniref:Uncharacterized protein n=1 Tax=Aspergillus granulosus TaxID=176169 RepID=A0ABR4H339_9EURO